MPANKLSLTYDRRILVEESTSTDQARNPLEEPSVIKFPKPSSMNTVTVVRKHTTNNIRGLLTLGSIDPTINQFRQKPDFEQQRKIVVSPLYCYSDKQGGENSRKNVSKKDSKTTHDSYVRIKKDMKKLLRKSSIHITEKQIEGEITAN